MLGRSGPLVFQRSAFSIFNQITIECLGRWAAVLMIWSWPFFATAQELLDIQIEPAHTDAGKPVSIKLSFDVRDQNTFTCGLILTLGDGTVKDVRVSEKDNPLVITHSFQNTGVFSVTAEGKTLWRGFQTVFGCPGVARSAPVSVHAEGAAEKASADEKKAAAANAAAKRASASRVEAERKAAAERRAAKEANENANRAASERKAAENRAARAMSSAEISKQSGPPVVSDDQKSNPVSASQSKPPPSKVRSITDL